MSVALPPRQFDRLCREAERGRETLPAIIRRKIEQAHEPDDDE